jgi:hypothetical protein
MAKRKANAFFDLLRAATRHYDPKEVVELFASVSKKRVKALAGVLSEYIVKNLPRAIASREVLADYRTNPYVLLTCANVMGLDDPARFADFLFNNKLYMGLETSFGKSVEAAFLGGYPLNSDAKQKWIDPPEKLDEFAALDGLSREEKARARTGSVWREIDKSCVVGKRRFITSIQSGVSTINDSQVQAMTAAIAHNHKVWMEQTGTTYPGVRKLDIVIGLTYGTDRTTNNKENQILVKLLDHGFEEESRTQHPGVLVDSATKSIRIYRCVGRDFWAFIGDPVTPAAAKFVFLEVLLALSKALSTGIKSADLEARINQRIQALAGALSQLMFPRKSLPRWVREDFSEAELFWFATAISAFYDEGV